MYETIYIEKNKSSRFGVHFYQNSSAWNVFLDNCGINAEKTAFICSTDLTNETWRAMADSMPKEQVYKVSSDTEVTKLRDFLDSMKKDYTFIVLSEPKVMNALFSVVNADDAKLSFVCVPVTPFAQFAGFSILPKCDMDGELICKELLPKAVYVDVSVLKEATPVCFLGAIASAFRLAISYKASFFEWIISNMYELLDGDEEALCEFLSRGYTVYKERIEKDTAKERSLPVYASDFYSLLSRMESETSEADLWALSMVCQSYLSWKKELLSMEEYYEIRDMFVFFGLGITETFATDEEMMKALEESDNALLKDTTGLYVRKIGKLVVAEAASKELVKDALMQIYFNEFDND